MSTETHPALTREEFNAGCAFVCAGVPLVDDEEGRYVYAYGHVDRPAMVKALDAWQLELFCAGEESFPESAVQHVWARTVKPASDPDGWWIEWHDSVTVDTPNAFALTVVDL